MTIKNIMRGIPHPSLIVFDISVLFVFSEQKSESIKKLVMNR